MATGYQSIYTGEQVDAAVARVQGLNTEFDAKVDKTTTINGEPLSGNITLNAAEVGAMPDTTKYARTITCNNGIIELKDQDGNSFSPAATATITGVTVPWGSITGNISDNTALQTALDTLQTNIDGKQATITGAATTIASSNLTNNRALISNGSGKVAVSSVTNTELGYLSGTTSSVQEQLNSKITEEDLTDVIGDYAQADLSNLTNLGDGVNRAVKGYNENGNLIYDKKLVSDVSKYAHSTFDRSKFTVVGSPNITDDGIASGFGSRNYFNLSSINFLDGNNWEIDLKIKTPNAVGTNTTTAIIGGGSNYSFQLLYSTTTRNLNISLSTDGSLSTWDLIAGKVITTVPLNTDIYIKIWWTGSAYYASYSYDGIEYVSTKLADSTTKLFSSGCYLGTAKSFWNGNRGFDGSIDLKQFSITVDGVEVFSGNKTGIDTIKPDDYTVVGSPTISADGVASGFSSGSGLKIPAIFTPNTNEVYTIKFKTGINITSRQFPFRLYNNLTGDYDTHCISIEDGRIRFQYQDELYGSINATANTKYFLKLEIFDGRCKYYQYSNNDWILLKEVTNSSIKLMSATTTNCVVVGNAAPNNLARPFLGSIDLNAFKIYVDGNLVYQPCLKIPYTESAYKHGSKIVDMQYLSRVKDAYEQGYSNRYYALQEDYAPNYSVVGTPTIAGTQASGFSNTSYLRQYFQNLSGKTLKIQNRFLYDSTMDGGISGGLGNAQSPILVAHATEQTLVFYFRGTSDVTFTVPYSNFTANTWYNTEAIITPTKQIFQVTDDNGNVVFKETKSTAQTFDIQAQMATYTIGYRSSTNYFSGTVDLAGFKVFVDGNFVGSPVVAPCVALPMGDIYGEIENLKELKSDLDRISQTKALTTGNVANYEEELKQITDRKHSTFDRSKFTVVGSPTITDDGIASGFSNSNYVKNTNIASVTSNGEFHINFQYSGTQQTTNENIVDFYFTNNQNEVLIRRTANSNSYRCLVFVSGVAIFDKSITDTTDNIRGYVQYKNGVYIFDVNGVIETLASATKIPAGSYTLSLGVRSAEGYVTTPVTGSIDLKQFSITVDGVEVFSGNKTGIDTIKPDDYTVIGSPTISADGIASGLGGNSNYINTGFIIGQRPFKQRFECSYESTNTGRVLWQVGIGNTSRIYTQWGQLKFIFLGSDDSAFTLNINNIYGNNVVVELEFTGSKYILRGSTNGGATWSEVAQESTIYIKNVDTVNVYIGVSATNVIFDLNAFKTYGYGNLVYQPCLKIPYTQSKTGSKIVNATYRDRVNDMYQQFGRAPYYTIDEENQNFTLPQGELYGLMGQRVLIAGERTGARYWELYSDRTLEQGGHCENGVEYTFDRPFANDTDFIITIPYSAKTATSFTPSQTGDFIAKGLGNL